MRLLLLLMLETKKRWANILGNTQNFTDVLSAKGIGSVKNHPILLNLFLLSCVDVILTRLMTTDLWKVYHQILCLSWKARSFSS